MVFACLSHSNLLSSDVMLAKSSKICGVLSKLNSNSSDILRSNDNRATLIE
jgi:hypothetical protein